MEFMLHSTRFSQVKHTIHNQKSSISDGNYEQMHFYLGDVIICWLLLQISWKSHVYFCVSCVMFALESVSADAWIDYLIRKQLLYLFSGVQICYSIANNITCGAFPL